MANGQQVAQQQDDSAFIPPKMTPRERILGGGSIPDGSGQKSPNPSNPYIYTPQGDSPLDKAISSEYKRRRDEAQLNFNVAKGLFTAIHTPQIDEHTHQPNGKMGVNPQTGVPLTDEEIASYTNQYNAAKAAYEKAAGVSKDSKALAKKHLGVFDDFAQKIKAAVGRKAPQPVATAPAGGLTTPPPAASPASASPNASAAPSKGGSTPPPDSQAAPGTIDPRLGPPESTPQAAMADAAKAKQSGSSLAPPPAIQDIPSGTPGGRTPENIPPKTSEAVPAFEAVQFPSLAAGRQERQDKLADQQSSADIQTAAEKQRAEDKRLTPEQLQQNQELAKMAGIQEGTPEWYEASFTGTVKGSPLTGNMGWSKIGYRDPETGKDTLGRYNVKTNRAEDMSGNPLPEGTEIFNSSDTPMTTFGHHQVVGPDGSILNLDTSSTKMPAKGASAPKPTGESKPGGAKPSADKKPSKEDHHGLTDEQWAARQEFYDQKAAKMADPVVKKAFQDYNGVQLRYGIMQKSATDALKGDQQAMLNILGNHIAMTLKMTGDISRPNQQLIEEAEKSAPVIGRFESRFGPDGLLTGVTLTPGQITSMMKLAKQRLEESEKTYHRAQDESKGGYGLKPPPSAGTTSLDDEIMGIVGKK